MLRSGPHCRWSRRADQHVVKKTAEKTAPEQRSCVAGREESILPSSVSAYGWAIMARFAGRQGRFQRIEKRMMEANSGREKITLSRDLSLFTVTMIGIGGMIGAGIFVLTGIAAGVAGPALILAFVLNGAITLLTASAYAELGSAYPEAGGGYLWVKEALGGYFLLECDSMEDALGWAARIPAVEHGAIEVRPVYVDPAEVQL